MNIERTCRCEDPDGNRYTEYLISCTCNSIFSVSDRADFIECPKCKEVTTLDKLRRGE